MKKFINNYEDMLDEYLNGFLAIHGNKVKRISERVVVRKDAPVKGKVGIVTGGGSGHDPFLIGSLGKGMTDAVAVGNIFAAPGVQSCYDSIKAADSGKGVIVCIGNYSGDLMNFGMAIDMLREEGKEIEVIVMKDDVASSPKDKIDNRRGIAGEIIMFKTAGAMADLGFELKDIKKTVDEIIYNTRSLGVAHTACIMPSSGKPSFEIGEDEMEIGIGHHGEPGIKRGKILSANETADFIMGKILEDLPFKENDEVAVLLNGLGSTALLEMYIVFNRVNEILKERKIKVHRTYIGEYITSMEMGGFSITLSKLNADSKKFIDHPCDAVHFVQI